MPTTAPNVCSSGVELQLSTRGYCGVSGNYLVWYSRVVATLESSLVGHRQTWDHVLESVVIAEEPLLTAEGTRPTCLRDDQRADSESSMIVQPDSNEVVHDLRHIISLKHNSSTQFASTQQ